MSAPHLALVLAAGQSKRMRSKTPKVLHPLAGKPLLRWAVIALLTARVGTENAYGRIVRDGSGDVQRIVEVRLATAEERLLPESNLGAYAIDLAWLRTAIGRLEANATGEIFFTDIVDAAI